MMRMFPTIKFKKQTLRTKVLLFLVASWSTNKKKVRDMIPEKTSGILKGDFFDNILLKSGIKGALRKVPINDRINSILT